MTMSLGSLDITKPFVENDCIPHILKKREFTPKNTGFRVFPGVNGLRF